MATTVPAYSPPPTAPLRATGSPGYTGTDLLLVCMALIWGVNISVVKFGTQSIAPLSFNSVRVAIAAAALLAIGAMLGKAWPARRDVISLLLLGVLGNGVYQVLFVQGIAQTRAGNAALVFAATPAIIALMSWYATGERVSRRGLGGIALSILGIAAVVLGSRTVAAEGATLSGDLLVLAAASCWAAFSVLLKPFTERVHAVHLAALTMLGGVAPLMIVAAPSLMATAWRSITPLVWFAMIFSSLGALVLAYLFWYRGVRVLGPTRTAMYGNLQPAIALAAAWILLGEVPTLVQGIGAGGIITGIILGRS
jgi:drug/metabolite transporter (DMT)-like permease